MKSWTIPMPFQYQQSFDLTQVAQQIAQAPRNIIAAAMREAEAVVQTRTPRDEGIMSDYLSAGEGPHDMGSGSAVGYYGKLTGINLSTHAPGGTIAEFMKEWRASHSGAEKREGHFIANDDPRLAWFRLSGRQQKILSEQRAAGRFGGPKPPPHYLGAVSGGRRPNPRGTPPNTHFVEEMGEMLTARLEMLPTLMGRP
jgi:hypothetical protein